MAEVHLLSLRDEQSEIPFDFFGNLLSGQGEALRQALHMCINHNPRNSETVPQDHIGGFPANPCQPDQLLHGGWNLGVVATHQCLATGLNIARLIAEEPGATDGFLDFFEWRSGEGLWIGKISEEAGCDLIDTRIGTLSAQDRGYEQLKWIFMVESTYCLGVGEGEFLDDSKGSLFRSLHGDESLSRREAVFMDDRMKSLRSSEFDDCTYIDIVYMSRIASRC